MTGARTFPIRLTVAQWDTLLAAVDRATIAWLDDAANDPPLSRTLKTQALTLTRTRAALVDGWLDGTRMERP